MKKLFKAISMLAVSTVMACGFAACGGGGDSAPAQKVRPPARVLYRRRKNIEPLKERLFRTFGLPDIEVESMCPVGGVHIGVGTVGIVTLASREQ